MDENPFRVRGLGANQGRVGAGRRLQENNQPRGQELPRRVNNQRGRGRGGGRGQGRGQWGGHYRNGGPNRQDGRGQEALQDGQGARPRAQQRERPVRQPGYRMLESLLDEEKCPAEVVQELTSFGKGLESLLSERGIRRDMMALLIQVMGRVCDCEDSPQSVVRVLNAVVDTDFLSRNLSQHINSMMAESDDRYLRKIPGQIGCILKLMQTLIQRIQNATKDVHVILTLIDVVARTMEMKGHTLESETKVLLDQLLLCCQEKEKEKARRSQRSITDQEEPPPNDFREIPIFPDVAEISTNAQAYLRPNVVDGRYKDLNHYLDVQFRLLRQDFVEPLKLGIAEYHVSQAQTNMKRKLKDIRIYHDVGVQFPICTNEGVTHRVSFDISKLRKVRWQATKRLTFGSLVCLSKDNFQSVIFATVANRKPEDLEQGLVDLRFQDMAHVTQIDSSDCFIMAESSAFFEAYRHVLQGLQEVRDNSLPLQRYIIEVSKDVKPPQYLRQQRFSTYDLSPLTSTEEDGDKDDEDKVLRGLRRLYPKASAVQVLTQSSWPRAETLHLDESQLRAVQAALTQELAVIQGPPGTGKTYIGLKIVQALLHNGVVWNEDDEPNPILVVCYTNHALDQFLEGILKFNQNIVRVGGRSNSEDMKNKNLNFLKREQRRKRDVQRAVHIRTSTILREMYSLRQCMEIAQRKVEKSMNGIINENFLQQFMTKEHYSSLTVIFPGSGYIKPTSCILEWLGLSGQFRVASGQELGITAFMEQDDEEDAAEEAQEEDEEIAIAEEADAIAEQRVLDDEEDDMFLFEEDHQENHLVLDIESLVAAPEEEGWQMQAHQKKRMRKMLLHNLRKTERMTERDATRVKNVWAIGDINTRWKLYRYWVSEYCKNERRRMEIVQGKYENLSQELKEVRVEEDLAILRRASVIGMTTTGAAKHRNVLHRVGCKIVVVEEAAEVLESHIITTLSGECQHLILIGDHQQLRPNPTVYRLAKEFKLDVSLFERMINNGVPCQSLVQQHRMRPEISTIMRNHFYKDLKDHESVRSYPKVAGIRSDIFFLDHDIEEEEVDDSRSKSNTHEVEVLVALCKYLIQQGQYQPTQITILTTYVGQLFNFKRRMPKSIFSGVRVCAVDGFQGEENDVILLSLVRSNQEDNIGFLKVSNRMCVALSRARHGFFCIGNFQGLARGDSLWRNIVQEMRGRGLLGQQLSLVCHNHPNTITRVSKGQDFLHVPEGGCSLPCEFRLDCGHSCNMLCHPTDPEHKDYKCLKKCEKILRCEHRCKLLCFQNCDRCSERVDKTLPCGHQKKIPCHRNPDTATCLEQCTKKLPCGHRCRRKCGEEPCTETCLETAFRSDWPCGHAVEVRCSDGPEKCPKKCGAELECSHQCQGSCGACKRGRLHVQCKEKCNRTLVCGHQCSALCTRDCPPCAKKCENRCVHSKCPNRCGDPCAPCQEPCPWRCPHYRCSKRCSEACDRPRCDQPCPAMLKCGHPCIGLCGEPCPDKCRVCHREEVTEILFGSEDEPDAQFVQLEDCGHVFEAGGLDQWMQIKNDDQRSIQLKVCPRCKTPIRRNLRYGNSINETLADIEQVKGRIFGSKRDIDQKKLRVQAMLDSITITTDVDLNKFRDRISRPVGLAELTAIENQLQLLQGVTKTKKKAKKAARDISQHTAEVRVQFKTLLELEKWLLKPRKYVSTQELNDCSCELQRLSMGLSFLLIKEKIRDSPSNKASLKICEDLLLSGKPLKESSVNTVKTFLEKLKKECTGLGISEEDRVMIVKAMGLSTGHWYKCPNGHCYAIGDCGGANHEGKCPECNSAIGGMSHRLVAGNALAPEMDGARYSAYSEQAFMENYDPRELQNLFQ